MFGAFMTERINIISIFLDPFKAQGYMHNLVAYLEDISHLLYGLQ